MYPNKIKKGGKERKQKKGKERKNGRNDEKI